VGSSAAWLLADAHRRLCLHTSSAFFQGKCCSYPFRKKKGAVEYSFCKMDTPSIPKYLHPFTFTNHI
jgi:hypothetical protein